MGCVSFRQRRQIRKSTDGHLSRERIGELRQGQQTRAGERENQSGEAGEISERRSRVSFFMNKILKTGPHRLQRRHRIPQFIAERRSAPTASNQNLIVLILPMQEHADVIRRAPDVSAIAQFLPVGSGSIIALLLDRANNQLEARVAKSSEPPDMSVAIVRTV